MSYKCETCHNFIIFAKPFSLAQLKWSANRGCDGCRLLENVIQNCKSFWTEEFNSHMQAEAQVRIKVIKYLSDPWPSRRLRIWYPVDRNKCHPEDSTFLQGQERYWHLSEGSSNWLDMEITSSVSRDFYWNSFVPIISVERETIALERICNRQ
jgi:hypothetical protein